MAKQPFMKMHGLGNDFVVLDARSEPLDLEPLEVQAIADRHLGIGCDQVIVLKNTPNADVFMQIFNADGGEVSACGNASRCIAWKVMKEKKRDHVTLETTAGVLDAYDGGDGMITVDMGPVKTDWKDIPLSEERDTLHLGFQVAQPGDEGKVLMGDPVAVNVGNPHVVFIVGMPEVVNLSQVGPIIENAPLFPERANVSVIQVVGEDVIKAKVWERGDGETQACGTAACAALVAAHRRGMMGRHGIVVMPGGPLGVVWREEDNHVLLTGPIATSFEGQFDMRRLLMSQLERMRSVGEAEVT
ncbi:MAG: diaminopimelate epimerase [Alphaproteobacteria bacterium]|nr:diaminopimelate epimerase [Alphaproteobacteria bacterium]